MTITEPTFDERNQALRDRWPQEHKPDPAVSHVKGDGGQLSNLSIMAGVDNPRDLFFGLDHWVPSGGTPYHRMQLGRLTQDDLPHLLRQMALCWGVDALSAAMLDLIKGRAS